MRSKRNKIAPAEGRETAQEMEERMLRVFEEATCNQIFVLGLIWREEERLFGKSEFPERLTSKAISEAFRTHVKDLTISAVSVTLGRLVKYGVLREGRTSKGSRAYRSTEYVEENKSFLLSVLIKPLVFAFGGNQMWYFLEELQKIVPEERYCFLQTKPFIVPDEKWEQLDDQG